MENKVGFIRRNLFVPLPQITNIDTFNKRLLNKCMALSKKSHWIKNESEEQLFIEDRFALLDLPGKAFSVVSYVKAEANKKGKVRVDGPHFYSTDPSLVEERLIVALGATRSRFSAKTARASASTSAPTAAPPTDTADPSSQLHLLRLKPGGWRNSRVRASLGEEVRAYMDSLDRDSLKAELRLMRDEAARTGWASMIQAVELSYATTHRIDGASIAVSASRIASGNDVIAYDEPVDPCVYDSVFSVKEA